MGTRLQIEGETFGRLTITKYLGNSYWEADCSCGNVARIHTGNLRSGRTRSCGCFHKENRGEYRRGIGKGWCNQPLYRTWRGALTRCHNPNDPHYPDYGLRGIEVAAEWRDDFEAFRDWILENLGERPVAHSLDRIDNDRGYEPGNLRWATSSTQNSNRRSIKMAEVEELRAQAAIWRDRAIQLGWTDEL